MKRKIVGLCVALVGCGGAPTPQPAHATAHDESQARATASEEKLEQTQEPSAEQPKSGPAKLTVVTKLGSTSVPAQLKVLGEDGQVVAQGAPGTPLSVEPGALTVEATITDPKLLVDRPTMRREITASSGEELTETVVFERCLLRVLVNIKGKPDKTAVVTLSRDGAEVAKLVSGAKEYVPISSGRYGVKVVSKRAEVTVSEIALQEGATQDIPINMN